MNIDGKYYDGISPVSQLVSCEVTNEGLSILNHLNGELIVLWPKEEIFCDENHITAYVLGHRPDRSKIELFNLDIANQLGLSGNNKIVSKDYRFIYKWLGVIAIAAGVFWISIPLVSKVVAKKIPFDLEVKASAHMKINDFFKPCSLNASQEFALKTYTEYIYPRNDLEKKMPITFQITNDPMVNAFTFPGGKIILMKGLLKEVKTPEELLGVMAHEIGHVVARDSAGFIVRGALLASFFGFFTGDFNSTFALSPQILLSTAALTFDRDMEKAADAYAAHRLMQLDVSTSGLRSFFSRRSFEKNFTAPEVLMTHPDYQSRIALIKETYPRRNLPNEIQDNWAVIKEICDTN